MKIIASLLIVLLLTVAHSSAKIIYVDASVVGGSGDGGSWADAFPFLQDGLQVAVSGDEVWVAKGVYYPDEGDGQADNDRDMTFQLIDGVAMYGGFVSGQAELALRDIESNRTILSGDLAQDDLDFKGDHTDIKGVNARHVVTGTGTTATTILDGFVMTAGKGANANDFGGGLLTDMGSPTVLNCQFSGNFGGSGGAVRANFSISIFRNCLFRKNHAIGTGGAIFAVNSPDGVQLIDCVFEENESLGQAGAVWGRSLKIVNCRFVKNVSKTGAAISTTIGGTSIINCLFYGNEATENGVVNLESGTLVSHCSFSGNKAGLQGGAIYVDSPVSSEISHCLIWNNESKANAEGVDAFVAAGAVSPTYQFCLIEGMNPEGGGNLDGTNPNNAPLFVQSGEPEASDFEVNLRVRTYSPTINRGDQSGLPEDLVDLDHDGITAEPVPFDLDGNPRVAFGAPDIGAYESSQSVLLVNEGVGEGAKNGRGWSNAFPFLSPALAVAEAGEEIWVVAGTYLPTEDSGDRESSFVLKDDVRLYGGFHGGETKMNEREPHANRTILSGDLKGDDRIDLDTGLGELIGENSFHVVEARNVTHTSVLDGFTIMGGRADGASDDFDTFGGGIYLDGAGPVIENCRIIGNTARELGGAVACFNSGKPVFRNCLMSGNRADEGSVFHTKGEDIDVTLIQCTMTQNRTNSSSAKVGVIAHSGGNFSMTNSILWGNFLGEREPDVFSILSSREFTATISHCLITRCGGSGEGWNGDFGNDGGGNLDADPLFVRETDYRLRYESPAVDAGDDRADVDGGGPLDDMVGSYLTMDLLGRARVADRRKGSSGKPNIDIGAYEYQGLTNTDIDMDGLSDGFELSYSSPSSVTSLEADQDPDGDGKNNLAEFVLRLDPTEFDGDFSARFVPSGELDLFSMDFSYELLSEQFATITFEWSETLDGEWVVIERPIQQLPSTMEQPSPFNYRISVDDVHAGKARGFLRYVIEKK